MHPGHYPKMTDSKALIDESRIRTLSPAQHLEACISRIDQLNLRLNAFITVLTDQARGEAESLASESGADKNRRLLDGMVLGIKDFYDTAGVRTTAAFELFKDRIPTKDAVAVAKLKNSGALIVGKTNMDRLGMGTTGIESAYGAVRNPWNQDYIPGGSSSGSAAAVASGMCDATLDTDAIGSCRLPAACCGVVGFKGTYGLISPKGILEGERDPGELIRWYSHPAITTRRVEDTAVLLDALSEQHPQGYASFLDAMKAEMSLTVGIADSYCADGEVETIFRAAAAQIAEMGYQVTPTSGLPRPPMNDVSKIEADRQRVASVVFKNIDLLLLPTTTTMVPALANAYGRPQALSADNTSSANYYGLPAISVPCGVDSNGLPVGLQIVGKPWSESSVLHLAYHYQTVTPWKARYHELHGFEEPEEISRTTWFAPRSRASQ